MKTDRELLELAARAYLPARHFSNQAYMLGFMSNWDPLTDDGQALRLAHALGMHLALDECHDMNDVRTDIVMAAAAIGEGME